jgi:putative ATPase
MTNQPLAERLRPQNLEEFIGQKHLVGQGAVLKTMIDSGHLSSMIFWGPPGVGKTTLAKIIANTLNRPFYILSAINSGVKDVRDVIDKAKNQRFFTSPNPILFIDEIHRFSKSQQDSLLGAVEEGLLTLIGATTENPSFEVISPLLSRCQVYILKSLEKEGTIVWQKSTVSGVITLVHYDVEQSTDPTGENQHSFQIFEKNGTKDSTKKYLRGFSERQYQQRFPRSSVLS